MRYYEKIGVMRRVQRDAGRRRFFRSEDLAWIEFIKRLKDTGMPLAEIKRYADLREKGRRTLRERYRMLQQHAAVLADKIEADSMNLDQLKRKMAFYRRQMSSKKKFLTWS